MLNVDALVLGGTSAEVHCHACMYGAHTCCTVLVPFGEISQTQIETYEQRKVPAPASSRSLSSHRRYHPLLFIVC